MISKCFVSFSILAFCVLLTIDYGDADIGDRCGPKLEEKCILVTNCKSAVNALKNRKHHGLKRCGFEGTTEIVCCADDIIDKGPAETRKSIVGVIKLGVLLYYRIELGRTLDNLETGVFAPNPSRGGETEEKLIKDCILISNRQTSLYYLSVIMVCFIGGIGTMAKRVFYGNNYSWELPFLPFSWFNVTASPNYEIVWFYQFYWRMMYALIVSSTDSLIAGVLAHISTQCKILQNAIRRVIENAFQDAFPMEAHAGLEVDPSQIPWTILEKHMKEMVDYHLAIINLANKFEELFNMLVLCVFSATLFILCFIMYHASLFDLFSMRAAQDFSYVGVVTIQVFLYCYWGNEVRLASENVSDACWHTNFVGADVRFQKGLALIIRRCQKPIVLTAGKFTDLSLKTYAWIIRASYSYYMVLRKHHSS